MKGQCDIVQKTKTTVLCWTQWKQCDWEHFNRDITCSLAFPFGLPCKQPSRSPFWVTIFFSLQLMDESSWRRNLTQSHVCCAALQCWQTFCGFLHTFINFSLRTCIYKKQHGKKLKRKERWKGGKKKTRKLLTTERLAKRHVVSQELKLKPNRSRAVFEGFIICFAKEEKTKNKRGFIIRQVLLWL